MINKDICPYNEKYQRHGYWERYYDDGDLYYRGNYINGKKIGYWEINGFNELNKRYYIR